jgi:hypothetical protein
MNDELCIIFLFKACRQNCEKRPCLLLYVRERPTYALLLFKVYSLSYFLLYVSLSSMPSSGSLHVPTELLVPSESLLIKFFTMDGRGFKSLTS